MTLSDKIYKHAPGTHRHPDSIPTEDVKEFTNFVLNEIAHNWPREDIEMSFKVIDRIKKEAGGKLTL